MHPVASARDTSALARSPLLRLPATGRLLVCTDLHGNLKDFTRMAELFEVAQSRGEEPFLLFSGDLIHGPSCEPEEWPEYLGAYFRDESGELVQQFIQLKERHPGRVECLLGNHEHSHVGGPHTPKFWPDETAHFEESVGPERAARFVELFRSFSAVALAPCGVVITHAAPNVHINGREELETLRYGGLEDLPITSLDDMPILGRLLWSRSCRAEVARRFLDALADGDERYDLVVYGHEIVSAGYERVSAEQLLLSTSFGVSDRNKRYLSLDLAACYGGVKDIREGQELVPLYP